MTKEERIDAFRNDLQNLLGKHNAEMGAFNLDECTDPEVEVSFLDDKFGWYFEKMLPVIPVPSALDLIAQEREKQISKGRTPESDEKINFECQLARAASDLAYPYENGGDTLPEPPVPLFWDRESWNRLINKPYKERLIVAAALIVAELDRLNLNEKEVKS